MLSNSTNDVKSFIKRPAPLVKELEGAFIVLLLTFLVAFVAVAVMGFTVNVPPGATLEFRDVWLLRLGAATSVPSSASLPLAPKASGGGTIVLCIVHI
jgi:hypothetical protein